MWRIQQTWQFLCDSCYDLFHLDDEYGQGTLNDWWKQGNTSGIIYGKGWHDQRQARQPYRFRC